MLKIIFTFFFILTTEQVKCVQDSQSGTVLFCASKLSSVYAATATVGLVLNAAFLFSIVGYEEQKVPSGITECANTNYERCFDALSLLSKQKNCSSNNEDDFCKSLTRLMEETNPSFEQNNSSNCRFDQAGVCSGNNLTNYALENLDNGRCELSKNDPYLCFKNVTDVFKQLSKVLLSPKEIDQICPSECYASQENFFLIQENNCIQKCNTLIITPLEKTKTTTTTPTLSRSLTATNVVSKTETPQFVDSNNICDPESASYDFRQCCLPRHSSPTPAEIENICCNENAPDYVSGSRHC